MTPLTIIQARMDSKRLPGKALAELGGKPVLEHVIRRVREARFERIAVATTWLPEDDPIAALAHRLGVRCFRGHPTDVLSRFLVCLRNFGGDYVVRVTADCPFLDPDLLREVAELTETGDFDYVGVKGAPDGLHQEAITADALRRSATLADDAYDREHVVTYAIRHMRCGWVQADIQGEPCTLDTLKDFARLRRMVA